MNDIRKRVNIYIQKLATGGDTYETGCLVCQGQGSGLINMFPLQTHRTVSTDEDTGELIFNYVCNDCVKTGPPHFDWVWVDKLPIFPDDIAITEIPDFLDEYGKKQMCKDRNIRHDDYA